MHSLVRSSALAAAALLATGSARAVTFTAGTYTENFNTLAATSSSAALPAGFTIAETGTSADQAYTAGTGSSNTGDTYSFGVAGTNPATDRALGMIQSGTNGATLLSTIGAVFTNGTGATVTSLTIGYTGEMWRLGQSGRGADRLDFSYSLNGGSSYTDLDLLDFNSPVTVGTVGALDGNAAANRTVLSATLANLSLASGQSILLRWSDFNVTGADDGLAIDDFNLTPALAAAAVPEPTTWALLLVGFGAIGSTLRRRPRVASVAA